MTIKEIEAAITQLPAQELAELMAWLQEYHAQAWDKQIEDDLEAGRLDALLDGPYSALSSTHPRPLSGTLVVEPWRSAERE
jgi:hypothetical protein